MPGRGSNLPALVIHGGAGRKLALVLREERVRESLHRIVTETFHRLRTQSALDCVVWAVTQLEDDPQFNAGTGGALQRDGVARLTAGISDGESRKCSGVINVEKVKNPILVARALLKEQDRVLCAEGARKYARTRKFGAYNPATEKTLKEWRSSVEGRHFTSEERFGTVGAVAVDRRGHVAAATSTGGKGMEVVGRVSDSATVAGNYASRKAAVSTTGVGEEIVEAALAARIVARVDDGRTLTAAFQKTFRELRAMKGRGAAIGVDWHGHVAVDATTQCVLHAIHTPKRIEIYP